MVTLDAINPLDSFNKGPKKMFYITHEERGGKKAEHSEYAITAPYSLSYD